MQRRCVFRLHSDPDDEARGTTTAIWQSNDGDRLPGLNCKHSHCAGRRLKELLEWLESKSPGIIDRHCSRERVWDESAGEHVSQNQLPQVLHGEGHSCGPQLVLPDRLALLRLDTDWYESTKHELIHLFPLLDSRGLLIIDDYGHWQGARKAVDEYFSEHKLNLYLHRVDYGCRVAVRTGA
jgi:hypothetical protein